LTTNHYRKEPERCEKELTALLYPDEVAGLLRCSTKDVHGLVRAGELSCVQVSPRKRLFTTDHIHQYIESKTIQRRIDKKTPRPVSSKPKRGGERRRRPESFEVQGSGSLVKEIQELCH
jgi:hypothetical protein